jgi:hypothetical protein
MMLQLDASPQDWLEGRGPRLTLVGAGSPQAKGRIERLWGTFQDRLVSELRLAGAKTRAELKPSWRTTCRSLICKC